MIVPLNLPKAELKLTRKKDQVYIWCVIRKKDLVLTPEEWVRQHMIHFILNECRFPIGRIAAEYQLSYNGRKKRADIMLFNKVGEATLIVECKAPEVPIDQKTMFQIAQYHHSMNVNYLMLTNGLEHSLMRTNQNGNVEILDDLKKTISALS